MSTARRLIRFASPLLASILCSLNCGIFDAPLPPTTNPYSPNYEGDYTLEIAWETLPDTLVVGFEYILPCTTGADTFIDYEAVHPLSSIMETGTLSDSVIAMKFLEPYEGRVVICGVRPNERTVSDSAILVVIEASSDTVLPRVHFTERRYEAGINQAATFITVDSVSRAVSYVWRFGNGGIDTATTAASISRVFSSAGTVVAYVHGVDKYGRAGADDSAEVVVQEFVYVVTASIPDTIQSRRSITFTASVSDAALFNAASGRYYWQISVGVDTFDTSGVGLTTLQRIVQDSSFMFISVWAEDTLGRSAPKVQKFVVVRDYKPVLSFVKNRDTVNIDVPAHIAVRAHDTDPSGGGIDSIFYDTNGDGQYDRRGTAADTAFDLQLSATASITAFARDKDGFSSAVDTMRIAVRSERPYFSPAARDTTIFKGTTLIMKVNANVGLSGAAVTKYYWKITGVQPFADTTTKDTLHYVFSQPGDNQVTVICEDSVGMRSAQADTFIVHVDPGYPVVSGISPKVAWIHDPVDYTVTATDPNGIITQWLLRWNTGEAFENGTSNVFTHTYTTAGIKRIAVQVRDNDGYYSDTLFDSITVNLGAPSFGSIAVNKTPAQMFIAQSIAFTIKGSDPNGTFDSVLVSWTGNETFTSRAKTAGDSAVISNTFTASDIGQKSIRFRLKDDDGITADSVFAITVLSGAPSVSALAIDTTANNVFVKDTRTFSFTVTDPNDNLTHLYFDVDGVQEKDSVISTPSFNGGIKYDFSLAEAGARQVRVRAVDASGQADTSAMLAVNVRLGAPVLWGDSGDTLWIVVGNGYRQYYYRPHYYDTNGTVVRWYFANSESDTNSGVKLNYDSTTFDVTDATINKGWPKYLSVLDDDGVWSGATRMVVFADSAPPAPTFFTYTTDGDSTVFKWERKLDVHDGLQTKAQIAYCFGAGCTPSDSLFAAGNEPTLAEIESKWGTEDIGGGTILNVIKADLPQTGPGRWRVILIDERGSRTACESGCPASFVAP